MLQTQVGWINLFRLYPEIVFPSLWANIGNLISDARMVSPKAVLYEINRGNDELVAWCKKHPKIFYDNQWIPEQAMNITNKHPALIKHSTAYGNADPHVIALAVFHKRGSVAGYTPIIVTGENIKRESGIPYVAGTYDIETCKLLEMFKMEGWKF